MNKTQTLISTIDRVNQILDRQIAVAQLIATYQAELFALRAELLALITNQPSHD
jgi:hypothetical protein